MLLRRAAAALKLQVAGPLEYAGTERFADVILSLYQTRRKSLSDELNPASVNSVIIHGMNGRAYSKGAKIDGST